MFLAGLGAKLPLYAFKKASKVVSDQSPVDSLNSELGVEFLDSLVLGEVKTSYYLSVDVNFPLP